MTNSVTVLKLDSHKGTNTTSFFAYAPSDGTTVCIVKANKGGLKVGDTVEVGDLIKLQKATEDQLKRFTSIKASGIDASLLG